MPTKQNKLMIQFTKQLFSLQFLIGLGAGIAITLFATFIYFRLATPESNPPTNAAPLTDAQRACQRQCTSQTSECKAKCNGDGECMGDCIVNAYDCIDACGLH